MFRCTRCQKVSLPGDKPVRLVVETREKVYPFRSRANRRRGYMNFTDDEGGRGQEIKREVVVCKDCNKANGD